MSCDLVKRLSINEKNKTIKIRLAANNIRPLIYETIEVKPGEGETFKDVVERVIKDIHDGNLHLQNSSKLKDISYAMYKVEEKLKEVNFNEQRDKAFEDNLSKRLSDEEYQAKMVEINSLIYNDDIYKIFMEAYKEKDSEPKYIVYADGKPVIKLIKGGFKYGSYDNIKTSKESCIIKNKLGRVYNIDIKEAN